MKLACSTFYILKDTFNRVSVPEGFVAEMHPEFVETSLQPRCAIYGKFGILDGVFIIELAEKPLRKPEVSR